LPPPPLALLGGEPVFDRPRHVGAPFIPPRELLHASLDEILDSRWLTNNGPCVHRLERMLASRHGATHAVAMCNATIALQLLLRALGAAGEVILPSFTFIATAHAARWENLTTRFADIATDTHCIDPAAVAEAVGPDTAAIIGVNLWGQACEVEPLGRIASGSGIPLLLDAAQALGSQLGPQLRAEAVASGALAAVISLHATKIVSGLEGGAILTNDGALAEDLRLRRNFGFAGYDNVVSLGTNAKMDEFSAAFAIRGLECLDGLMERNRAIGRLYQENLADLSGLSVHAPKRSPTSNHHYSVLMVDGAQCPLTRDELMHTLWAENILARRYFFPGCHRMEPYASQPAVGQAPLPCTDAVAAGVLVLPASSAVDMEDVPLICERIRCALQQHEQVRERLYGSVTTGVPHP
jgi:dTDP-4-amino-4,6-dideoxygalactose transaminase